MDFFSNADPMQIVTLSVSVLSIFISNFLGRRAEFKKFKLSNMEKRYYSFYVPLLKRLSTFTNERLSYYEFDLKDHDGITFIDFLIKNIQYLDPESASLISDFAVASAKAVAFYKTDINAANKQDAQDAEELFFTILSNTLVEAEILSKNWDFQTYQAPF